MIKRRGCGCGCLTAIILILVLAVAGWWVYNNKDTVRSYFYPRHYEDIINKCCAEYGVDKWLVMALIREESGFDPNAESAAGARGLMQLMPDTAAWLISKGEFAFDMEAAVSNTEDNITLGVYYLSVLKHNYSGYDSYAPVIAAYNAGIGSVDGWLASGEWDVSADDMEHITYKETSENVRKVLRSYDVYRQLYE